MRDKNTFGSDSFTNACRKILVEHPEAIGVAYKGLDCGCALVCGVSAKGDPIGSLIHVTGQPVTGDKKAPICLKCKKDNGLNRVVQEGISWPGDENELPDKELRLSIGRKVFGPDYLESL
jgi:hypothetical protein